MDDFDETTEELGDEDAVPDDPPTYRATILPRTGRVSLTGWAPWLARGGALGKLLRERERAGVAIADLSVTGADSDEVIARFYSDGGALSASEDALVEWASHVGYRRLWLSDRMVALDPAPEQIGHATVRCPTCRAGWADANPEFWLMVREQGEFPRWCPVCGFELPQWRVGPQRPSARPRRPRPTTRRASSDRRPPTRPTKS